MKSAAAGSRHALPYQTGSAVDEPAVELDELGAGFELGAGLAAVEDAAGADDGQFPLQGVSEFVDDAVGGFEHRGAGEAALLVGVADALDLVPSQGGVGGDDAIDTVAAQGVGDVDDLGAFQVGGDLQGQGHVAAVLVGQASLGGLQGAQEGVQFRFALELAEVLGVGRGDVDRDVAGQGIDLFEASQVVVGGALDGSVEVLADVDAQHAVVAGGADVGDQGIDAVVVEAHAVDDALYLGQPEQAGPRIAGLRAGGDGADLQKTEAQPGQAVDGLAVLVQAGSQAHPVREAHTHHLHRPGLERFSGGQQAAGQVQAGEGGVVGVLGVETEEQGAHKFVEHRAILPDGPLRPGCFFAVQRSAAG